MIVIEGLKKSFGDKHVVRGIDLTVQRGEKIAIIGASGCGKSTTLRLLMGLHPADDGKIIIDGQDVCKMDMEQMKRLRMKFGFLFQSGALFDFMTVEENVSFPLIENTMLPKHKIKERVKTVLKLVEMSGTEHLMPSDLSGGMRKRIGLARAIAPEPQIILYDEPTTGLDPVLSTNIEDLIVKLSDQTEVTSITVTHQISTIMRTADNIYMVDEGRLLDPETPASIRKSKNDIVRNFINGGLGNEAL
jgi:phospholipid/cholesterol/gamma-HCH transport system ATP-binding protein